MAPLGPGRAARRARIAIRLRAVCHLFTKSLPTENRTYTPGAPIH
jgi:hypothetical protein